MKWQKKGLVCNSETLDLSWYKKNTMVPLPYLIATDRLRIFLTMCDADNVGRIGYIDVDPDNPGRILDYSRQPVLDIGDAGSFSDSGVLTSSLLQQGDDLYLYYSAYQKCSKVPYLIMSGVAVSTDGGYTFSNLSSAPLLDRVEGEIFVRSSPAVMQDDDGFHVWFSSDAGQGWIAADNKSRPSYDMKYMRAATPTHWPRAQGAVSIPLQGEDEHGITCASFWKEDKLYKSIYAIRSLSKGYRLGYAESTNGARFVRKDREVGIDVSEQGWDSEMITFPRRFVHGERVYLFYCGNGYGTAGMGYAELINDD